MVEGMGFEPTHDFSPNSLANCPLQPLEYYRIVAGHIGLEPIALRLTAECSTIELMSHF